MDPKSVGDSPSGRVLRAPTGYYAFVPHPLPPALNWPVGLVAALSEADRALGELAGLGRSLLNPHLLIAPFVRREAVLSSRIEGTQASLSDLYAYEAVRGTAAQAKTGRLAMFKAPPDVHEVHNYVRALEYGRARLAELPLSLRLIREIHARLMEGVRGEEGTPGEFRRSQNWIGPPGCSLDEALFVPPPVPEMKEASGAFETFLHTPSDLPPVAWLGLVHYQFEAIHPFLDGNGRIGRLLLALLLCTADLLPEPLLYLSAFFEAHRQTYYDLLLAVSRQGAWEAWLDFFLRGVADQAQDAITRAQRLQDLREQYRARFQEARAAGRLLQTVDLLFVRPVLTMPQMADALGVNYAAASRYISQLEDAGIVREVTGQARNRVYRADEVLAAIEEPLDPGRGAPTWRR